MLDMLCKGNAPSTKNVQQLFPILWDVLPDELRKVAGVKSRYGWSAEEAAARTLMQFGAHVPSTCFEEVYQEILAVWCGNYWGRSTAHEILRPFIDRLNTDQIRRIARMFQRQHPPARRVVLQLAKGTRCELVDPSAGTVDDSSAQG